MVIDIGLQFPTPPGQTVFLVVELDDF